MLVRLQNFFSIWSLFFILFANVSWGSDLNDWSLNLIKKNKLNPEHFAFYLGHDELAPTLNYRSKQMMLPASITKLITASAVLHFIPPGSKFKTILASAGRVEDKKLKGDLTLVGGGDPSFVSENMWVLVNHFVRNEITEIEGSIVVDDSLFDEVRYDASRESVRVDRAYDAPVGAMSFNWNSINVYVRPNVKGSGPARVILDPISDYFIIENTVKTTSGKALNIDVDRRWDEARKREVFTVRGQIGKQIKEHLVFANIQKPDLWSGHNLKAFLSQRGISVTGEVKSGKLSANASVLAEVESKPIELIMADMNKFSNNYVSEMLTKNVSLKSKKPGTLAGGVQLIREHFDKTIGHKNGSVLVNPSGLTRENRISPYDLWAVLEHHRQDFSSMPEFFASLPIAGVDGTLKKRFKDENLERKVRAKTGLLNGVASLAGYLQLKNGTVVPFVFIYNGPGDLTSVRATVDQILEKTYSHK